MRDVDLFQQALGLSKPWHVTRSEFDVVARRLDLHLDFEVGGTFVCPECGRAGCKAYDTSEKQWRHLNFFQHEAYLHARVPRVDCEQCGVKLVQVPWARSGSGFTLMFEALVLTLAKSMTVAEAARLVGEHDTKLWRIIHFYVDEARARADFSGVRNVGVDETSIRRHHDYITLVVDLDRSQLLFATAGKDAGAIAEFRADLERHGGHADQIEQVCIDMSPAFKRGVEDCFPLARRTFDRFHVMKQMNDAVDSVRREEVRSRPELRGTRYVWAKNPENLTISQIATYDRLWLPGLHLKTVRAYHLRLAFQDLWKQPQERAAAYFDEWYRWAVRCRMPAIVRVAKTFRENLNGILNWFESAINNGLLEGLNSLLQAAKAKARGYRTIRNMIAIGYLLAGKLDLMLPI